MLQDQNKMFQSKFDMIEKRLSEQNEQYNAALSRKTEELLQAESDICVLRSSESKLKTTLKLVNGDMKAMYENNRTLVSELMNKIDTLKKKIDCIEGKVDVTATRSKLSYAETLKSPVTMHSLSEDTTVPKRRSTTTTYTSFDLHTEVSPAATQEYRHDHQVPRRNWRPDNRQYENQETSTKSYNVTLSGDAATATNNCEDNREDNSSNDYMRSHPDNSYADIYAKSASFHSRPSHSNEIYKDNGRANNITVICDTNQAFQGVTRYKTKRYVLSNVRADQPFETVRDAVMTWARERGVHITFIRLLKRIDGYTPTFTMKVNVDAAHADYITDSFWPPDVRFREWQPYKKD